MKLSHRLNGRRVLEIENYLDRKPRELSGGQRQRVALGRAIVRTPQAFLMDEPLSNLMLNCECKCVRKLFAFTKIGVTTIYVTHDQIEAMTMGDRIVVMEKGIVQQVDTPEVIYNEPANLFVANFIGNPPMNFVTGKIEEREGFLEFHTKRFGLRLTEKQAHTIRQMNLVDRGIIIGMRPENISFEEIMLEAYPQSIINGTMELSEFVGSDRYYHMNIGSRNI